MALTLGRLWRVLKLAIKDKATGEAVDSAQG
jgi:hypothetical protein